MRKGLIVLIVLLVVVFGVIGLRQDDQQSDIQIEANVVSQETDI
ncbi:hypothetical protein [Amphibacillus indicireducens]|uniref:Uncharacterized protein n=1 Tax=Amphibacillus indicireducens TaxID=1076330 RepID=A0ABP7W1F8_9BACI